jgi:hypothetical protein
MQFVYCHLHYELYVLSPPYTLALLIPYLDLDRNNIAAARLGGLEEDLGLVGTQYSTCLSILYVGCVHTGEETKLKTPKTHV